MSRRPFPLVALALVSAAAAVAAWLVALGPPAGRALDAGAMQSFTGVARPPLTPSINGLAHLADPAPLLLGTVVLVLIALLRRRPLMAALVPVIVGGANLTTQLLKPTLADLRVIDLAGVTTVYPGSWPSGHATAAMSLALCCVLVVGPELRALAALFGAGYASPSATRSSRSAGTCPATSSAASSSRRRSRCSVPPRSRRSRHAAPSASGWRGPVGSRGSRCATRGRCGHDGRVRRRADDQQAPGMALDALGHPAALAAGVGIGALGLMLTAGLAAALRH